VQWHVVAAGGYAQNTADWRVELDGGRRVFVKQALDDSSPRSLGSGRS
jgi:hypothetical protein